MWNAFQRLMFRLDFHLRGTRYWPKMLCDEDGVNCLPLGSNVTSCKPNMSELLLFAFGTVEARLGIRYLGSRIPGNPHPTPQRPETRPTAGLSPGDTTAWKTLAVQFRVLYPGWEAAEGQEKVAAPRQNLVTLLGPAGTCQTRGGAGQYLSCAPPIDTKFEATFGRRGWARVVSGLVVFAGFGLCKPDKLPGAPCNGQSSQDCDFVDVSLAAWSSCFQFPRLPARFRVRV